MESKQTTTEVIRRKFQLDRFTRRALADLPAHAPELLGIEAERGLENPPYDWIAAFVKDLASWETFLRKVSEEHLLTEGGIVYFLYPKRGNKVYDSFIHRDDIFPALGVDEEDGYFRGTDLKFNQMFSLNEVFTVVGVRMLPKRPSAPKGPSRRAGDYEARIPEVEEFLKTDAQALRAFQSLTPGYRRNYARHILGVKTQQTRQKRLESAVKALKEGKKTP